MDWIFGIFQNKVWILTLVGIAVFLVILPVLFRDWVARRLGRVDAPPKASRPSNVHPFPSRGNAAATAPEPVQSLAANPVSINSAAAAGQGSNPTQGARGDALAKPDYSETPTPFSIIAEVCSLYPPARERVEQSYRGMDVRWKLRLAGISEGVEKGPVRSIRMYPDARSAQSCGIYFVVNLEEHPGLESARKDEAFVVEGTIENVSGMDIDLKNVHKVQKAA